MAICLIVTKANLGGAQRYVESLAKLLSSRGVVTTVVAGAGDQLLRRFSGSAVRVVQFSKLTNQSLFADLSLGVWVFKMYRRGEFEIFVFNSTKVLPVAWLLSFFLPSTALCYVCHGFPFVPGSTTVKDRVKALVFFKMLSRFKRIICVSKFVRSILHGNAAGRDNLVLAVNTLDPATAVELSQDAFSRPVSSPEITLAGSEKVALWPEIRLVHRGAAPFRAVSLAELNGNKGIDALCMALAPHREDLEGKFEWHIFGEGEDRALVESLIETSDLQHIVKLHGFRADARTLLKNYDALVIPSRNEAFGMVALEAAACGVFVLAVSVGGIREAIVSNSHGYSFRTLNDLAEFVRLISSNQVRPAPPAAPPVSYWTTRYDEWSEIHIRELGPVGR